MASDDPSSKADDPNKGPRKARGKTLPSLSEQDLAMLPGSAPSAAPPSASPVAVATTLTPITPPRDSRPLVYGALALGALAVIVAVGAWVSGRGAAANAVATAERLIDSLAQRLTGRTDELTARVTDLRATATADATAALARAAATGGGFERELAALAVLSRNDADLGRPLAALSPHARSGVPTLDALRAEFADLAGRVLVADLTAARPAWVGNVAARIAGLSFRINDRLALGGASATAAVRTASAALAAGNLRAAAEPLRGLTGASGEAAKAWLARANARLAADDALADLTRRTSDRLAAARR